VEEEIVAHYAKQEMRCPCHLCIGQEAIAAGVCAHLTQDDYLFGTYRGHGVYLAKGGSLKKMIAELYGKETGITRGKGGSMQLVAPEVGILCMSAIVGGTLPMAVGAALAQKMVNSKHISVAFFGDGATEEGVFHESLNFAALKRLPVVFICENNFYSVYSHQSVRQAVDNIHERAAIYSIPSERVDGNNVLDVYRSAYRAIAHVRAGRGPSFIEFRTYRYREHVGTNYDWHLGYRSREEVKEWMQKCPVATYERYLLESGLLSESSVSKLKSEVSRDIDEAFRFARESSFPAAEELYRHVYFEK
jgi:pyruvate dehydrogenase E1 component alpha subunit